MAQDLSPGKSACILAVVVGCFAILWPSIFYPMLKGSVLPPTDDRNEYIRQEQSHHRPNAMHPALREHGRAVPQPHSAPPPPRERRSLPPPVIAAKKPPVPGLRPPMAGGGHAPSHKDNGPMGILMPLYTVGVVIFFVYTITKLLCKKNDSKTQYIQDKKLHRLVQQNRARESKRTTEVKSKGIIPPDTSKLGWQENDIIVSAISSLLEEVNHDILKREMKKEQQDIHSTEDSSQHENSSEKLPGNKLEEGSSEKDAEKHAIIEHGHPKHDSQEVHDIIEVEGNDTSETCANEQSLKHSFEESATKSSTPENDHKEIITDIIFLNNEPANSKIVSDAHSSNVAEESGVVLESKVTKNVIAVGSDHTEADENETKEHKVDVDDDDKEIILKNDEGETSKHDSLIEVKDVPHTKL